MAAATILLFGELAERFGRACVVEVPAAGCTVSDLRASLAAAVPDAAVAILDRRVRAAVAQEIAAEHQHVLPGQEIAFLSPVSGG